MNLADKYVVLTDIWGNQHQGFLRQVKEEQVDHGQSHIKLVLQETANPSSLRTKSWFVTWTDSLARIRYEYRFEDEFAGINWSRHGGLYDSSFLKAIIGTSQIFPSIS